MNTLKNRPTLRTVLGTTGAALALVGSGVVTAGTASAADTGIPVLEAIKQCESGGSYTAQNPTSTASGAYQFLDSTWQSMDAAAGYARAADAPESVQDAAAIELYTEQGTNPWLASYSCWSDAGSLTSGSGESSATTSTTTASEASTVSTVSTNGSEQAPTASTSSTAQAGSAQGSAPQAAPQAQQPVAPQDAQRPTGERPADERGERPEGLGHHGDQAAAGANGAGRGAGAGGACQR